MSDELIALIVASLVGILPNIILKWLETRKSREDREKSNLESADIAQEMLRDIIDELRKQNTYLNDRIGMKTSELDLLRSRINKLENVLNRVVENSDCLPEKIQLILAEVIKEREEK